MASVHSLCEDVAAGAYPGDPIDAGAHDTTEVRWFVHGAVPSSIFRWFARLSTSLEIRRDEYRLDGYHDIGLKRRDRGPAEVKVRCGSRGSIHVVDDVTGRLEEWRKVSAIDEGDIPLGEHSRWLDVNKVVLTRTYHLNPDGIPRAVPSQWSSTLGCDVELASVMAGEMPAWTFALEAWGPTSTERSDALDTSLSRFLDEAAPPPEFFTHLGLDIGYPEWLATEVGDLVS
jgi:hypothetical protein